MSTENEATPNVPMSWADVVKANKAQQEATLAAMSNGPSFISLKHGDITVDGVAVPGNTLDVIVLSFVIESNYYTKAYDAANPTPPACYSLSNGLSPAVPSLDGTIQVNATCEGCPMKEWGSNPNGRGGKACSDHVRVAVIPADIETEADVVSAQVKYVKIPTMSVELFQQFVKTVDVTTGLPPFAFRTSMKTVRDPKTQFKLHWATDRSKAFTDESVLIALYNRKQQVDKDIMFTYPKMEDGAAATPDQPARRSKV